MSQHMQTLIFYLFSLGTTPLLHDLSFSVFSLKTGGQQLQSYNFPLSFSHHFDIRVSVCDRYIVISVRVQICGQYLVVVLWISDATTTRFRYYGQPYATH